ncbi:hypothetical protein MTR_0016s0170 [Medicago truncatula]|uniref:Uncharacterized protein n=1 Tax=Medicago truncatula TaxID=3880 RepID=A0A072TIR7_MEDTR|nr:hypothetical protein MTR_0016s0170 [Medicago truncatula]
MQLRPDAGPEGGTDPLGKKLKTKLLYGKPCWPCFPCRNLLLSSSFKVVPVLIAEQEPKRRKYNRRRTREKVLHGNLKDLEE